jgi:hypothetical protein
LERRFPRYVLGVLADDADRYSAGVRSLTNRERTPGVASTPNLIKEGEDADQQEGAQADPFDRSVPSFAFGFAWRSFSDNLAIPSEGGKTERDGDEPPKRHIGIEYEVFRGEVKSMSRTPRHSS